MLSEPTIVDRGEQPYAGIRQLVTMESIGPAITSLMPELFAGLDAGGVEMTGPPFVRFNVIDMDREMDIEVGIPVAGAVPDDGRIEAGTLPAGRYATVVHTGDYPGLVGANAALQEWAEHNGLRFAMAETPEGDRFDSRVETYLTDPAEEPDPAKWETEVAYLLADGR
jgi:RNA polymerase sigma-70 factor (ECF subfamily)